MRSCSLFAVLLLLRTAPALREEVPDFHAARSQMVYVIRIEALITSVVTGIREIDARVLTAMSRMPRHEFVAALLVPLGYEDTPLPVDVDQNLTQPFLAALLTLLLQMEPGRHDVRDRNGIADTRLPFSLSSAHTSTAWK